jgi:branched-chain amino acid transport system permease protein
MTHADGASRLLVTLAVGVFALAFPLFATGYHIYQGAQVLIYAIALLGLNLLTGFNGQISLGHGAFFAIGGYGAAILIAKFDVAYWAAIPLASVVCFVAGFLFGFPALRFGGLYLALATFALAVATPQILSYKGFDLFTGGSQGLTLAKPHAPLGLRLSVDQWLYLCCLLSAAALYWAARNLVRGRIGRALIAIRDQPIAAEAMGVNAALYKTTCFGVSALYAGVAGGLSAITVGFVSPESFGLSLSLAFLVGIVVGGLASLGGVLFGALFIEFVPNIADQLTVSFGESAKALPGAIYGVLLILVMFLMPTGAAGAARAAASVLTRWLALLRRPKVENASGGPNVAAKYEGKGESL